VRTGANRNRERGDPDGRSAAHRCSRNHHADNAPLEACNPGAYMGAWRIRPTSRLSSAVVVTRHRRPPRGSAGASTRSTIYRLLFSRVGNRPDAEDLSTEVFMAALGPLRITATRVEVRAYLAATARTVLAGYWRRRLGVEITAIDPELAVTEPDDPSIPSLAPTRARAVLATLPERHRRVLELRFLEARSVRETAREMGISVANAKVLQHRALRLAARAQPGGEA
jgi:RNA polymerase sigma factor (sigma-70 family)